MSTVEYLQQQKRSSSSSAVAVLDETPKLITGKQALSKKTATQKQIHKESMKSSEKENLEAEQLRTSTPSFSVTIHAEKSIKDNPRTPRRRSNSLQNSQRI
jgi:hypothetical protein